MNSPFRAANCSARNWSSAANAVAVTAKMTTQAETNRLVLTIDLLCIPSLLQRRVSSSMRAAGRGSLTIVPEHALRDGPRQPLPSMDGDLDAD